MERMKRCLLALALAYALSACIQSSGRYGANAEIPTVSVSPSLPRVGEPVTVTLMSSLYLSAGSELPYATFSDVRLGACFYAETTGGFCGLANVEGGDPPLQPWVAVPDGQAHVADFGDVVVERGASYPLEHTFTFTATEAKTVKIDAWVYRSTTGFIGHVGDLAGPVVIFSDRPPTRESP